MNEKSDADNPPTNSPRRVGQDAFSLSMESAAVAAPAPAAAKPGIVHVSSVAPKGKGGRSVSAGTRSDAPIRTSFENGNTVEPLPESAPSEPAIVEPGGKPTPAPGAPARSSRRADAKTAIREEMNALRSKGPVQPGAMSVTSTSATSTAPSTNGNDGKAALRAEVDALRSKSRGEPQGPGVVSVSGSGSSATATPARDSKAIIRQEMAALREKQDMNRPGAVSVSAEEPMDSATAARAERASRKGRRTSSQAEPVQNKAEMKSAMYSQASSSSKKAPPSYTSSSKTSSTQSGSLGSPIGENPGAVSSYADEQPKSLNKDLTMGVAMHDQERGQMAMVDSMSKQGSGAVTAKSSSELTKHGGENTRSSKDQFQPTIVSEDGLVAAQVIDEELLEKEYQERMMMNVVAADAVSEKELKQAERGRCRKLLCCLVILIGAVVGIAVPLAKKDGEVITNAPTEAPTLFSNEDYLLSVIGDLSGDEIFNATTPQGKALEWLLENDTATTDLRAYDDDRLRERYALAVFYYSTAGEEWQDPLNFLTELPVCNWTNPNLNAGVTCDANQTTVVNVLINGNNLAGSIPSEMAALSNLQVLQSVQGSIGGTIPSELAQLTDMRVFQVTLHELTGTIPSEFSRLTNLVAFNVYTNQLTGKVENTFADSRALVALVLGDNQFTGSLPELETSLPLQFYILDDCRFSGTIPQVMTRQKAVNLFRVNDNDLSGTIDPALGSLEDMTELHLHNNQFSGSIPTFLAEAESLGSLLLNSNDFTGTLPTELATLRNLVTLDLSENGFQSSIPAEFESFESLKTLDVSSNPLTGLLPSTISKIATLEILDISKTDIVDGVEQAFCSSILTTSITADCGGNVAGIDCSCCSGCCEGEVCDINLFGVCEARAGGFEVQAEKEATCTCTSDGSTLECNNACQSCNRDRSVCVESRDYGYTFNATTGEPLVFRSTLQYVTGLTDTVEFTSDFEEEECVVSINGQECTQCSLSACADGNLGLFVDCQNIESNPRVVDLCNDFEDGTEYLEVFYWTDIALRDPSTCEPELTILQNSG